MTNTQIAILENLLHQLRSARTNETCRMLRELADEIETESDPLESMVDDEPMLEYDAVWEDR